MSEDVKKPKTDGEGGFSIVDWFVGIKSEFKRVTWPNKPDVARMTVIVITTCAIFGVIIVGMDAVIAAAYNLLFGLVA